MYKCKRALRLAASDQVLIHPSEDDIDEGILVDLLDETVKRRIPGNRRVLVGWRRRDRRLNEWGYDNDYIFDHRRLKVSTLRRMWQSLPGAVGEYSEQNERDRIHFFTDALERRENFLAVIGPFMAAMSRSYRGISNSSQSQETNTKSPSQAVYPWSGPDRMSEYQKVYSSRFNQGMKREY